MASKPSNKDGIDWWRGGLGVKSIDTSNLSGGANSFYPALKLYHPSGKVSSILIERQLVRLFIDKVVPLINKKPKSYDYALALWMEKPTLITVEITGDKKLETVFNYIETQHLKSKLSHDSRLKSKTPEKPKNFEVFFSNHDSEILFKKGSHDNVNLELSSLLLGGNS